MIRLLLGAVMIAAGAVTGLSFSFEARLRARALAQLIAMLTRIEIMIRYEKTEVPRLLDELRRSGEHDLIDELLYPGRESREPCYFKPEEAERLRQVIQSLGTTDEQGQLAMIGLAKTEFSRIAEEARAAEQRDAKLFAALGLLGGVFLAVMMI